MACPESVETAIAALERALAQHTNAEVRNLDWLRAKASYHTAAMCKVLEAVLRAFPRQRLFCIVEAEISSLGCMARPEDMVFWIEGEGVFVVEVKSHCIDGIRSFENNVPQVVYRGNPVGDVDLLEQPRDFAYKLLGPLQQQCVAHGVESCPLFFVGWLPNVGPEDVAAKGAEVARDRVWFSDMLERECFIERMQEMNNISGGANTDRAVLEPLSKVFGVTIQPGPAPAPGPVIPGSMRHEIDRRTLKLKVMTAEQEKLAFSPNLLRGPKVIRGVAGSGKSIVLANAVAEVFVRYYVQHMTPELFPREAISPPKVLVLCYNRTLVRYLRQLVDQCFEHRKQKSDWHIPREALEVVNIDRYAGRVAYRVRTDFHKNDVKATVKNLVTNAQSYEGAFDHIFIDEGQDFDLEWYPFVRFISERHEEVGHSIVIFYDEAQNLYGVKMPGVGAVPAWKEFLGAIPSPRGLPTVMCVGHRNTNQILTFSFNLLLGAFAEANPQMAEFAGISDYGKRTIPDDPAIDHPNAGRPCVERLDERQYRINFAVSDGPLPSVRQCDNSDALLEKLSEEVSRQIDPSQGCVLPHDILIMAPRHHDVENIAGVLRRRDIATHIPVALNGPAIRGRNDPRDRGLFQDGKVTISTIKSAKGYTAPLCHVVNVEHLGSSNLGRAMEQGNRAQLHVACTRSSYYLYVWGLPCSLMREADDSVRAID